MRGEKEQVIQRTNRKQLTKWQNEVHPCQLWPQIKMDQTYQMTQTHWIDSKNKNKKPGPTVCYL